MPINRKRASSMPVEIVFDDVTEEITLAETQAAHGLNPGKTSLWGKSSSRLEAAGDRRLT